MADTNFTPGTVVTSEWLNDVNDFVYTESTWGELNVFEFLTAAEITSVKAYDYSIDVTVKVQQAMDEAFAQSRKLVVPAGGYRVTTLNMPGSSATRVKPFIMEGAGIGEVFATVQNIVKGGTVFRNTTVNATQPVFQYVPDIVNTGNGYANISNLIFWGNTVSGVAVVDFDTFYSQSRIYDCAVIQDGPGDGMNMDLCATPEIFNIYSINNPGWITASGGSYVRTGTGFKFSTSLTGGAGLTKIRGTTSRGWDTGYQIGNGVNPLLSPSLRNFECSNTKNGVKILALVNNAMIDGGYFEGGDSGTAIQDNGNYSIITNNSIFAGYAIGIDASNAGVGGTLISGNSISAGTRANTNLVLLGSSGASGGTGKAFVGNTLSFSGSVTAPGTIANVIGLTVTGTDPQLQISGTNFDPRAAWTGTGSFKMVDNSISGGPGGSRAKGNYGFGTTDSVDQSVPALNRGVISLAQLPAITSTVATNTIRADHGGWYDVTFAGATTVSKIADGGQEGRIVYLNSTNGNTTWSHNANLKLAGAANFTPGANGGLLIVRVYGQSGGFVNAVEVGRVVY